MSVGRHNRLTDTTFKTSGGTTTKKVHYTYDVFDRRIGKQVDDDGNGTYDRTSRFVYDGEDTVLVYDGASSLTNRYLSGPAVDQVFSDESAVNGILWGLPDNEGTIRDVAQYNSGTNTTTVVNHLKYDAFGKITAQSDPGAPGFAFTGREWDPDVDLFYYRARWYDPKAGRFISEDPMGFAAGDVNLSRYVGNAPTNYTDPSGLVGGPALGGFGSSTPGPAHQNRRKFAYLRGTALIKQGRIRCIASACTKNAEKTGVFWCAGPEFDPDRGCCLDRGFCHQQFRNVRRFAGLLVLLDEPLADGS